MRLRFLAMEVHHFPATDGDFAPWSVVTARRSPDFHVRRAARPATSGLTLVTAGGGTWSAGGAERPLGPGSIYASSCGASLEVRCAAGGMAIRQVEVAGGGFPDLVRSELGATDGLWRLASLGGCLRLFDLICDEARNGGSRSTAIAADLIRALVRTVARDLAGTASWRGSRAVFERAREWLEREPDARPDLAAAARHCGVTVVHLCRVFRHHAGCPPAGWARGRRLDRAAARLAMSDDPVTAVAAAFGWSDPYAFSRAFRRRFAVPPRVWRRQAGA